MSVSVSQNPAVDIDGKHAEAATLRAEAYEIARQAHDRLRDGEAKLRVVESELEKLRLAQAEAVAARAKYEALYSEIMAIAGEAQ